MMDNAMEQKKEYVAPQMEVVQFQLQDRLLQDSPTNPPEPPQPDLPCNRCNIEIEI